MSALPFQEMHCLMLCRYDDMCAPFLKAEHRGTVKEIFQVVTREAVSTYLAPRPRQQQHTLCAACDGPPMPMVANTA